MIPEDSNEPEVAPESSSRYSRVEETLAAYIDRLNRGEMLDEEKVMSEHSGIGREIWESLATFRDVGQQSEVMPSLGTLGDYTLRRQIGRGGMGVVYEAWENSMDRAVALKVLPPGVAADERALQRFVREAKTAGQLNHQNVVSVHGMGVKEQTPYYPWSTSRARRWRRWWGG